MTSKQHNLTSRARRALAARVGRDRFEVWFGAADSVRIESDTLVIAASDRFSTEWMRRNFAGEASSAAIDVLGPDASVAFIVDAAVGRQSSSSSRESEKTESEKTTGPDPAPPQSGKRGRRKFASLVDFVEGDCNRLAVTAARMVAKTPGDVSPLFIYGPSGTGKTHLLEGVWSVARRARTNVLYLTAEQFTSYFVEALQGSGLPSFRRKHRDVQMLLIDNIQFFAGKRATLNELLHTVDTFVREGRQLVFAGNRSPAELSELGPELTARMAGGLVCPLQAPSREVRRGMLQSLAKQSELSVSSDVLDMMADQLFGDARQLAGAVHRLRAVSEAMSCPITMDMARRSLEDLIRALRPAIGISEIEQAVCEEFGVQAKTLHSPSRGKAASHPRMLAMWLARKHTPSALSEIGEHFGRRSHATVLSAQKKVESWRQSGGTVMSAQGDMRVDEAIRRIESRLRAG